MRFFTRSNVRVLKRNSWLSRSIVTMLGAEVLFLSTFTELELPVATQRNLKKWVNNETIELCCLLPAKYENKVYHCLPGLQNPLKPVRTSAYTPIVPASVMTGYVLGSTLGACAAAMYVICGLLGPYLGIYVFAEGGTWGYCLAPGMGYLLGLIPGAFFAGYLTRGRSKSAKQITAAVGTVVLIHTIGICYLLGLCLASRLSGDSIVLTWKPWAFEEIRNLSWYPLLYDIIFSILLVGISFPLRWLVHVLVTPQNTRHESASVQLGNTGLLEPVDTM